jgi:hypothetical protein
MDDRAKLIMIIQLLHMAVGKEGDSDLSDQGLSFGAELANKVQDL